MGKKRETIRVAKTLLETALECANELHPQMKESPWYRATHAAWVILHFSTLAKPDNIPERPVTIEEEEDPNG